MSSSPVFSHKRGSNIEKTRVYPADYGLEVSSIVNSMSVKGSSKVAIVGSSSLRQITQSPDYDCYSEYTLKKKGEIEEYTFKFRQMVDKLMIMRNVVLGDIKCGEIEEWKIQKGQVDKDGNVIVDRGELKEGIEELQAAKVVSKDIRDQVVGVCEEPITIEVHFELKDMLDQQKVRWTPEEVLIGHKYLADGRMYTLEDGLMNGLTKIDVIAWVADAMQVEVTMIQVLKIRGRFVNVSFTKEDTEKSIEDDIVEYGLRGKQWKQLKRMFALDRLRSTKPTRRMMKMMEILNSDLGKVAVVIADAKSILQLVENGHLFEENRIRAELDTFINRLNKTTIPELQSQGITKKIKDMERLPLLRGNKGEFYKRLDELEGQFEGVLNKKTKESMDEMGL